MPNFSLLPHGFWLIVMGISAGLILAHFVDVLVHWWRGEPLIRAHFSPKGGCTEALVAEIHAAKSEILVQAYSFTNRLIADALIGAAGRGLSVMVLLDKSNLKEMHTELGELNSHGIELLIDGCHAIAHNKVMVIDQHTVVTGSFNFTNQAEHENAENLLILRHQSDLAKTYRQNFANHKAHCTHPGEVLLRKGA